MNERTGQFYLMKMEFDLHERKMMFISRWCTNFDFNGNINVMISMHYIYPQQMERIRLAENEERRWSGIRVFLNRFRPKYSNRPKERMSLGCMKAASIPLLETERGNIEAKMRAKCVDAWFAENKTEK